MGLLSCHDQDGDPERDSIECIPYYFLPGGYSGRAENDERTGGANVHELSYEYAFCVEVEPGDEHAHGGHGESERQEKREPVCTVRRSGSEVIDDRQVPQAPKQS